MNHLKRTLLRRIRPIHESFRNQKIAAFLNIVNRGAGNGTLLDVGG
jgi:hypothetical protein